ncbi:hypothetical protein [Tautonia rosea]|uniref:hypothetical protein n=1 Tax=Tautonia rosea TaxID=2728037 RepID=UPI0014747430|nr:hypothetical protein [Tautonia rosea]
MKSWVDGFLRIVLDRSIEELIGAILLSVFLSAAAAWLGLWLCRSRKDATARLTGVILVVSLLSMGVGATFIETSLPAQPTSHNPSTFSMMSGPPAFYQMVLVLDANGNGQVDVEELRKASVALGTADLAFPNGTDDAVDSALTSFAAGAAGPNAPENLVDPDDSDTSDSDADQDPSDAP